MKKPIPENIQDLATKHFQLMDIEGQYFLDVEPGKEFLYKQILSVANFKRQGEKLVLLHKQ